MQVLYLFHTQRMTAMKTLYLLGAIYIALITQGCTTTDLAQPAPPSTTATELPLKPTQNHHHKDPLNVSFITPEKQLNLPYQVVGKATVSKFNAVGVKRQEATIRDIMRQLAASLDGDAVMDVKRDKGIVTAKVIAYKQLIV
jgi:hypothetical protein